MACSISFCQHEYECKQNLLTFFTSFICQRLANEIEINRVLLLAFCYFFLLFGCSEADILLMCAFESSPQITGISKTLRVELVDRYLISNDQINI